MDAREPASGWSDEQRDPQRFPARNRQRGQVVPLVAVALVLVGVVGLGLVRVAVAAARQGAAQAAADAVALAGVADGPEAADTVAAANDAQVEAYRRAGADVVVTVERRGHRATVRARWVPDEVAARPPPQRPPTV